MLDIDKSTEQTLFGTENGKISVVPVGNTY